MTQIRVSSPPQGEQPKLCKDCRFCVPQWTRTGLFFGKLVADYEYAKCARIPDLVSGMAKTYCEFERDDSFDKTRCGRGGKFWEPRS
jgi:hypothetical protein